MTKNRQNQDMYDLYESYKKTLHNAKKTLAKRQKTNAGIREKYSEPFKRRDHIDNTRDITCWNQMISELETDMKEMEMYLEFDDRILLHRDYNNMKNMIYDQSSYEGEIPFGGLYEDCVPDISELICDIEIQEEIVELLDDVLTERQKQVIHMYFFECKTQEKIAKKLGIKQNTVSQIITNSIEILRSCIKNSDFIDF